MNDKGEALRNHLRETLERPNLGCYGCKQRVSEHETYRAGRDPCYGPYLSMNVRNEDLRELLDGCMDGQFDESTCDRCHRINHVWSTPVEVWQAVYGPGGQPTRQGVLCPSCFMDDAEEVGVTAPRGVAGWTLRPDDRREAA